MARNKRVSRPKDELKRELVEQLSLLRHACETFDRGMEAAGKHIALTIRVLIHEKGGRFFGLEVKYPECRRKSAQTKPPIPKQRDRNG
jgi:hypothetical protein